MALDQEFFDSIQIDIVKKKYYNANKVNAVFDEIRSQAQELITENERLRAALNSRDAEYDSARKKLLSLQEVYRATMDKAYERADKVLREANDRAEKLISDAEEKNTRSERLVKECFDRIRRSEEDNLKYLNSQLQCFLKGIGTDEGVILSREEYQNSGEKPEEEDREDILKQRISLLAKEIREMETTE